MKDFLFFKRPGDLVDLLRWHIAIAKLNTNMMETRLRHCSSQHIAWLEASQARPPTYGAQQ